MSKIVWTKFWTRNFSLFRFWVYIESNKLSFYRKNFGGIFDYSLAVPDGKLIAYYHNKKELDLMTKKIYQKSCKNFWIFEKYAKQVIGWMQKFIDFNNDLNEKKLHCLSDKELLVLFKKWYKKYLSWQIAVYFFFVLEPICTEVFFTMMELYLRQLGKISELSYYTSIIMAPEAMNVVALEQAFALRTAISIKKNPSVKNKLLRLYYEKFLWIPCYDIKDEPYDIKYFVDNLDKLLALSLKELEQKLKDLEQQFKKNKKDFTELLTGLEDKKLAELAKIMHWLVYYKDHRDDKRRELGFAGKKFMSVLAERMQLTLEEINYFTPPELEDCLRGKKVDKKKIRERIPTNFVLLSTSRGIELVTGRERIEKIIRRELEGGKDNANEEIRGVVGSKGLARGKVAIVRHSTSLSKVKAGDVLVAVTTQPEYVPAMKLSSAIVTDEGGVTSHAAIVAREFKKPCIVATKNATKVLKDGDLAEVDAKNGIVRKILK